MTITFDATTNTYGFTHGTQTYGGFPTIAAAQEAAYDAERGTLPADADDTLTADEKGLIDEILTCILGRADTPRCHVIHTHEQSDGGGIGWDRYAIGEGVALCIEGTGGCLCLQGSIIELDDNMAAELLDLHTLLSDPRVHSALEAIYNIED